MSSSASGNSSLPLARVKTIMKSSPEVESVTQETLFLITRATVNFKFQFLIKYERILLLASRILVGCIRILKYNVFWLGVFGVF